MNEQEVLEIAQAAVEACPADQAEAFVWSVYNHVTRFAENRIHQNTAEHHCSIVVRAVQGKRIAIARGETLTADDARRVARRAAEMAEVARELPDFKGLPEPKPLPENPRQPAEDILTSTPADRADLVGEAISLAQERGFKAAGALTVQASASCVVNSLGVRAAQSSSGSHFHVVMRDDQTAGYASAEGPALADCCVAETARLAADIADAARGARAIEPGPIDVVLRPVAAAELLNLLSWGFSALAHQEQQSFTCDWLGKQACSPLFTLIDDGLDTRTYAKAFDFEGMPKQRVELIREGVVTSLVYDSYTAGREDPPRESTGHATAANWAAGPLPMNMVVQPGEGSLDDLVSRVDRGLLVSRIHYLNVAHRRRALFTGMTREGTLLIENGRIVGGVKNLRFTEHMLEALSRLVAVGGQGELHGHVWTPPLVIEGFTFTSATTF